MLIAVRVAGALISVFGILMSVFPDWFGPLVAPATEDVHLSVERRVRGGMVLGVGLLFLIRSAMKPWGVTFAWFIISLMIGAGAARIFGIAVEGSTPKQWGLLAVEGVLLALPAAWLLYTGGGR